MKKHLVKLSLALLSAVFILGCQDQGSGVVGVDLVPQFAKEKNCDPEKPPVHPSCKPEEPPLPEHTFLLTLVSNNPL